MIRAHLLLLAPLLLLIACGGDDDGDDAPAVEPAGRIVFTSNRDGNDDIFILDVAELTATNLTNNPDAGDREASVNDAGDRVAFISSREGVSDVWTIGIDGTGAEKLTDDPAVDARPQWSPDGSQVAYYSARSQGQGFLWVSDIETGGAGPLLDLLPNDGVTDCLGGVPTHWPEADLLVYQGTNASIRASQTCTVRPSDFTVAPLISVPGRAIFDAVLSPDGSMIAYSSDETGNFDIWVAEAGGKNPVRLTFDPGIDSGPSWSPDGQWLAFASQRDGDYEIYIMRPDGSDVRKLTENDSDDTLPDWTS